MTLPIGADLKPLPLSIFGVVLAAPAGPSPGRSS
jgi:hypothetical protein